MSEKGKPVKERDVVIGYGWIKDVNHPVPIFRTEAFKGQVYKTMDLARNARGTK